MARPFTFADRDVPAEVREHMPLFDWVREQAAAAKELEARIDAARKKHDATLEVLTESIEYGEVEEAKDRVAAAKRAALDDPAVAKAKAALKAAKKALQRSAKALIAAEKKAKGDVKALVQVKDETERGIVGALKAGRVPSDGDLVIDREGPAKDPR